MRSSLEHLLRLFVISGLFATALIPLIIVPTMYQPYASQGFAFRILVELTAGAWLVLACVHSTYRPRRSWILGTFAIFVVVMAVADVFGVNPFASFWSSYQRMEGWITLIHVFAYLAIASSVLSSEKIWQRLFQVSLAVSAVVSMYGFLQLAKVPGFVSVWQGRSGMRIDATLGNPAYLGTYLLFNIFIAALLLSSAYKRPPEGRRSALLFAYLGVLMIDAAMLFLSGSRSAVLGLICGGIVSLVLVTFLHNEKKVRTTAAIAVVIIPILLTGLFVTIAAFPSVHDNGPLKRFEPHSLLDSSAVNRLLMYEMAWDGFKDRPVLGWGQENFSTVSFIHFNPALDVNFLINSRVHNVLLQMLIDGGIVGLLSYLSIIAAALLALWRKKQFSITEASILTGLLCGYFVQNLTSFDTVVSLLLFATVLAYIAYKEMSHGHVFAFVAVKKSLLPYLTVPALLATFGIIWWVNGNALFANQLLFKALTASQTGSQKQLEQFKQAISLNSLGTDEVIREQGKVTFLLANNQEVSNEMKREFAAYAVQQKQLHVKEYPRNELAIADIYEVYGDYANGEQALLRAHTIAPDNFIIISKLIGNAAQREDAAAQFRYMGDAFRLHPEIQPIRVAYATLAVVTNNINLSDELLAPVIASGSINDINLIQAYLLQGSPRKIVDLLQPYMQSHPNDTRAGLALAAAHYITGNKEKAIQTLQALASAAPRTQSEVRTFISQIETDSVPHDYLVSKFAQSN